MELLNKIRNVFYEVEYNLYNKWFRFKCLNALCVGEVIMYHHITDEEIDDNPECVCSTLKFKEAIDKRLADGTRFISSVDIDKVFDDNKKFCVITFDDVPSDFYMNAYPILKSRGIPFTLFITVDFIDKVGFLTRRQLEELSKNPLCTIGAHTMTHPILRTTTRIAEELQKSKKEIELIIQKEIEVMAYPYGRPSSVSLKVINCTKKSGYKFAFSTIQTRVCKDIVKKCPYYIPRIVVN